MVAKTHLSDDDFKQMLSHYKVGDYVCSEPIVGGSVQTNYWVKTDQGQFVLKHYENRSVGSVGFEANLLVYIRKRNFPCAVPMRAHDRTFVTVYSDKPVVLFDFIEGEHVDSLTINQRNQIIKLAATLQNYTKNYLPQNQRFRWNYDRDLMQMLLNQAWDAVDDPTFDVKGQWYQAQLDGIELESHLPKSVCHCDFDYSNILWDGDDLVALIDFDDANRTYSAMDLCYLLDMWAWIDESFDLHAAQEIIELYRETRELQFVEKRFLYEIHRFKILIDSIWFFGVGDPHDFPAKQRMAGLQAIGYDAYTEMFFGEGFSI